MEDRDLDVDLDDRNSTIMHKIYCWAMCEQVEIMNSNPAAGRQNNSKPRQPRSIGMGGMGVMAGPGPRGSGYPLR